MKKKHEKEECPHARVRRFGGRRRQCRDCGTTWSVWQRRRGRKRLRSQISRAAAFILHRRLPVRMPGTGPRQTRHQRQYRLAASRKALIERIPFPPVPADGHLVMVADAVLKFLNGAWHTWYFFFVRTPAEDEATILAPLYRPGTETVAGWRQAFDMIPPDVSARIAALVCDGYVGLAQEARWRGWLLQRCQFHLLARIQSRRSRGKSGRRQEEGKMLFGLVREASTTTDADVLARALARIEEYAWHIRSRELKNVLMGFVNHADDYRTYLRHPELRLPITNNTAEAFVGLVEDLGRRARGFRTVSALHEWIVALVKVRRKIRCAPKETTDQQN